MRLLILILRDELLDKNEHHLRNSYDLNYFFQNLFFLDFQMLFHLYLLIQEEWQFLNSLKDLYLKQQSLLKPIFEKTEEDYPNELILR